MNSSEIKGAFYIALKDLKTYYLKPPNISWGIMFPIVMTLAFILRNPSGIKELAPGLIAMSILFASTSAEAIVIVFERRTKTFERLLLAPLSIKSVLFGKVLGGIIFGFLISSIFLMGSVLFLKSSISNFIFLILSLLLSALVFSVFGTLVSVYVKEIFDAMTLANFFRFPMIFLCGVFLPVSSMPSFIQPLAYIFPLTYSIDLIRFFLTGTYDVVNPLSCAIVLIVYSIILFYFSVLILKRRIEQ
jgi:ABC-2 type transport system permease protein